MKVSQKRMEDALLLATRGTFRAFHPDADSHMREMKRIAREILERLEKP